MDTFFASLAEGFDLPILDWIRANLTNPFLDTVMPHLTRWGDAGFIWIVLAVFLLCFRKTRKTGLTLGLALIIGLLVCNLTLKPLLARIRPYDYQQLYAGKMIPLLMEKPSDFSFPSGHTITAFEGAAVVMLSSRKWGIPTLCFALTMAFSRLYLYFHYPTDVLASMVLGTGIAFLAAWLVKKGEIWCNSRRR